MLIALDTESTYAKERDIRSLGVAQYVRHPKTHHYLVAVYGPECVMAGEPPAFPWQRLKGAEVVSHNAAFDQSVVAELRRRGLEIPQPAEWNCSADLAAYLQCPRSLVDAAKHLLGLTVDKKLRAEMKGVAWTCLTPDEKVALTKYCLLDAKTSYTLWQNFSGQWPEQERAISRHTALMCRRGIGVDLDRIGLGIMKLEQVRWRAEQDIPWAGDLDEKGKPKPITSPKLIAMECRQRGITPPDSTDVKSEEFGRWLEAHEQQGEFIQAIQQWRQANRLLNVLETMRDRQVDGVLSYSLKYFGAPHTGRWSGDAGLNLHNLPRKPVAGVDARACLIPRPGKVFLVGDYAQIEARITSWLAGDETTLDLLRGGMDLYEAHARRSMGYRDPRPLSEVNPELRQFAKCRVLGLGFGLGGAKFKSIVKQWTGKEIDETRAREMVSDFRQHNLGIQRLWRRLENGLRQSYETGRAEVELPSGRKIQYFNVRPGRRGTLGGVEWGETGKNLYGGLLTENLVQATARDLFAQAILRLEQAGLPVVLHVHDEVICEVDESAAEEALRELTHLLTQVPEWAAGLPVEVSAKIRKEYGK